MRVTNGEIAAESPAPAPVLPQALPPETGQRRSPASAARRGQIIAAAIEVLAESGYGQTTFARITAKAGLSSTRLISYHFGTKDDLMDAVLVDVAVRMQAAITERTETQQTAAGKLNARIEAELEWIAQHLPAVRAMYEICVNARDEEGGLRFGAEATAQVNVNELEPILRAGQESGEFRRFDTVLMALTLKSAIDAAIARLTSPPRLTLEQCVQELTTLARLATQREPGRQEPTVREPAGQEPPGGEPEQRAPRRGRR